MIAMHANSGGTGTTTMLHLKLLPKVTFRHPNHPRSKEFLVHQSRCCEPINLLLLQPTDQSNIPPSAETSFWRQRGQIADADDGTTACDETTNEGLVEHDFGFDSECKGELCSSSATAGCNRSSTGRTTSKSPLTDVQSRQVQRTVCSSFAWH
jgi:hypothetical protein